MKKNCFLILASLLAFSCVKTPEITPKNEVKLTMTPSLLTEGDVISVFNDATKEVSAAIVDSKGDAYAKVPLEAKKVKVVSPQTDGTYEDHELEFATSQIQTEAGKLSAKYYPMKGVGEINGSVSDVSLEALGSAFVFNAYNPLSKGETLKRISVKYSSDADPVITTLSTPWEVSFEAPSGDSFPGAIYSCVPKGKYSKVLVSFTTSKAVYTIKTDETALDLEKNDFFTLNVDLKNLSICIVTDEPSITDESSSFVDLSAEAVEDQLTEDQIPDFSSVGYHWGETDLSLASAGFTVVNLPAPSGDDDTEMIQNAIDNASEGTVLQFQEGTYNVDSLIMIDRSGIVLRGYGDKATTLFARGYSPDQPSMHEDVSGVRYPYIRNFICIGKSAGKGEARVTDMSVSISADEVHADAWSIRGYTMSSTTGGPVGTGSPIVEDAFCGSRFVVVKDASQFNVGDHVSVFRPATPKWIHAIKMDMIIKSLKDVGKIYQWTPSEYSINWERIVTAIHGDRVYLDAPLVMSVTGEYGGGVLYKYHWDRIRECGVENMKIVSDYDKSRTGRTSNTDFDNYHAASAVFFTAAEHCWVKDVDFRHFAESGVNMATGSRNITVQDCGLHDPISHITGGMRYGFHISTGSQCLVKNCTVSLDRHQFVTGSKSLGPNVFTHCTAKSCYSTLGPHQRWATGILWDCVTTNTRASVYDAGNSGTGHGWQGNNIVFWNTHVGESFTAQSPWVTGKNYVIGCTVDGAPAQVINFSNYANPGYDPNGNIVYDKDVNGTRPDAVVRPLAPGEPESLYESQLQQRLSSGKRISDIAY